MSGIRGLAGSELGADDVMRYCSAFVEETGCSSCAVARDTRPSGAALYDAASAALMASGADVSGLGVAPTPVAFYESRRSGGGAVIVTASHNPLEWNGLKFVVGGRGATAAEMAAIGRRAADAGGGGEEGRRGGGRIGRFVPESEAAKAACADYVGAAIAAIRGVSGGGGGGGGGDADGAAAARVVVDAGGGAAARVAPSLLEGIGCSVEVINAGLEGSTRGPDPTTGRLADLEAACGGGRTGFAFDLDGDRVVVVAPGGGDGRARTLSPDATLCLGVAAALEAGCRRFVLSIDTSAAAESIIREAGGTVWRSKVGEANVVAEMDARGAEAGGEGSSAGFILRSFNGCRDGILTAGMIAAAGGAAADGGGSPAAARAAAEAMSRHSQARAKVPADSSLHARALEIADGRMRGRFSESLRIDGVRWSGEGSWVLARGSNTEDAIRVSAEAGSPEEAARLLQEATEAVAGACRDAGRG